MMVPSYAPQFGYDEYFDSSGNPRLATRSIGNRILGLGEPELRRRKLALDLDLQRFGVTFTVYESETNIDRTWPLDIIPRVISANEWARTARGLEQRLIALNLFITDLYNERYCIRDGLFPAELLQSSRRYAPYCQGIKPKFGVWAHISGTDLVRGADGSLAVLEDNLRIPSGVSYMLKNRHLTKRIFPELFSDQQIQPVNGYVSRLYDLLVSLAPDEEPSPSVVLLTPGVFNSAYFEHAYLAQQLGIDLVEGQDLVVLDDDRVYMKTIVGLAKVDVIYRRIDDDFLDPEVGNPASMLGTPGLLRAWRKGNVAIVNAPGAGVADDKLVYSYVPDLIRYYLGEDAILANVPTLRLLDEQSRSEVLQNTNRYVVKPVNEAGGYGVVVGDRVTREDLERCRESILADPRNFVAQPIVSLSTAPTLCEAGVEPRHMDLRPFVLTGRSQYVTRGGLTRVALRKGSLVVNSSQGGGSKDTWIVCDDDTGRPESDSAALGLQAKTQWYDDHGLLARGPVDSSQPF